MVRSLTLDTLRQSQSPLHIPADGLQTVLKLFVAVMLLTPAGVITSVMPVTTFGHGRDTNVKLENTRVTGSENLLGKGKRQRSVSSTEHGGAAFYHLWRRAYISAFTVQKKKKNGQVHPWLAHLKSKYRGSTSVGRRVFVPGAGYRFVTCDEEQR